MALVVTVKEYGGPEVLTLEEMPTPAPGRGEIAVKVKAAGLNFVDVYERKGVYPGKLPFIAGAEGAGEVIAVGPGVTTHKVGDRVAWSGPRGGYAEERILPADRAAPLPKGVSYETAAAVTLKGTTAYYLLHLTYPLQADEWVLIHAAAGATGLLLAQWAKAKRAKVIGTAGGATKVALAKANGCEVAIDYTKEDFVARVKEVTGGKGVAVVYDGVGKATFEPSLDCLKPRGMMVSFGNASGVASIPDITILARKGSLYVTRPTTNTYFADPADFQRAAAAVFRAVDAGDIRPLVNQTFPLRDAQAAHRALEARQTMGSTLLVP